VVHELVQSEAKTQKVQSRRLLKLVDNFLMIDSCASGANYMYTVCCYMYLLFEVDCLFQNYTSCIIISLFSGRHYLLTVTVLKET